MRLLLRLFCLFALSLALVVPGFAGEPDKPKAKAKKTTEAAKMNSPDAKPDPAPPPPPASTAGADDKQLRPIPPTTGLNGLLTIESGEPLPAKAVTVGGAANKFSRNPGSITVLETQMTIGYAVTNRWSLFFGFNPQQHIHSGAQGRLSLNPFNLGCPLVPNTIYRSISCIPGGAAAYVEDFPFANRNTGGVGAITIGSKFNIASQSRGNPVGFSIRTDFIIPTATGLNSLLDNSTQTGQFGFNILGALTRNFGNLFEATLNLGYTFTRDPRLGGVAVLNQADQFRGGFGMRMFPKSRIQVITEYNGLVFVGTHTPNTTFGARDPLEAVWGVRLYPVNWLAFDIGYRYTLNQLQSRDRHGFVIKAGTTYLKPKPVPVNHPPTAACSASASSVYVGSGDPVNVSVSASDPDNDPLNYSYSSNGGTIDGTGPQVRWNSAGLAAGSYTVNARVDDGRGGVASCAVDIRVEPKPNRRPVMSCSAERSSVLAGERVRITANASDPDNDPLNYSWRSNGGQVVGSGGAVQLDTTGLAPGSYTVTGRVDDGRGGAADCNVAVRVENPPVQAQASKLNECFFRAGSARVDNVCKRVLDDVALRLGASPKDRMALVGFSDPAEGKTDKLAKQRAAAAKKYLAGKGVADSRVETRAAGGQKGAGKQNRRLDVILVPEGATY